MKKYFLLATVALFAATNANAAAISNKATLKTDATLQFAATYNCEQDLTFGTITLDSAQDLSTVSVTVGENDAVTATSDNVALVDGAKTGVCNYTKGQNGAGTADWFVNDGVNVDSASVTINNDHGMTGTVTFNKQGY
ncbi:MAG: hypothetical protein IJF12_00585, partial [Alphaproteobacteria bacterium]|nr:hypothetical protein [Alphaproteobacteria bacterium]